MSRDSLAILGPWGTTARSARALRVAVLSNYPLTRAGLSHVLTHDVDSVSVWEGPLRVGQVGSHDVVVYDLADASARSLDALAVLLARGVPVVALTSCGRSHLAETALAMGVAETVEMDVSAEELVEALERAASGRTTTLESHRHGRRDTTRSGTPLSDRELSVLELIGTGMPNREIAEQLHLSINTLKTYIRVAYRKLGVTTRAQAVVWAAQHDLIPVSQERHPCETGWAAGIYRDTAESARGIG